MKTTETISPHYAGLDSWDDAAILRALTEGQEQAIAAVRAAEAAISRAARAIVARIGGTGRILYVGAGSSGTIAALDGMELGGTFGWPDDRIGYLIAEGDRFAPIGGGGEDDAGRGEAEMRAMAPSPADVVIAVSASGTTPFTLAAARAAKAAGAMLVALASNREAPLLGIADQAILLETGAEVIVGSTRMGAGTAQKAALNMLSTLVMIRLGRIHDGLMVDLRVDNGKLAARAVKTLQHITSCSESEARMALDRSDGHVKTAALVLRGLSPEAARLALAEAEGSLRTVLARLG